MNEEQLKSLDFEPTQAESDYVDAMADTVIQDMATRKRFEGRRNRSAFKRMRRPHLEIKREAGSKFIFALLDRFKVA